MSRREVDRRGDRERDTDYRRKEPAREPVRRPQLNEYWIDGEGIHRQVLQSEICKWLGPEATCKPGDYNGRQGFKIRAVRPFTPDMIVDLKVLSKEYIQENRQAKANYREEVSYEESATRLRREPDDFSERYPSSGPSNLGYGSMSSPYSSEPPMAAYPSAMYSSGPTYPSGTAYTMSPGMAMNATHGIPQDSRYASEYTYQQPPRQDYPPGYGYPAGSGYVSRGESMPGYHPTSGANPPRMEETPRQYADYPMGGMGQPNYGVPQRQNPSPYEPVRGDPYVARQQSSDPYAGARRR